MHAVLSVFWSAVFNGREELGFSNFHLIFVYNFRTTVKVLVFQGIQLYLIKEIIYRLVGLAVYGTIFFNY